MRYFQLALLMLFPLSVLASSPPLKKEWIENHAPLLQGRRDLGKNPSSDIPLLLTYSLLPAGEGFTKIRYTIFFSDEDSVRSARKTDRHLARYGRRLDVEWIYEVKVSNRTGSGSRRKYHCDMILGAGHRTCAFRGEFQEGTDRPILYNIARHNVFRDCPAFPQGSPNEAVWDLPVTEEIPYPQSRDFLPLRYPEMLRISDEELLRERKLTRRSTEYLYLRLRGKLTGKVFPVVRDQNGKAYTTGDGQGAALQEMGLDLWGRESVVAIWLPTEIRTNLLIGAEILGFNYRPLTKGSFLEVEDFGAYLVEETNTGEYRTVDVSTQILR